MTPWTAWDLARQRMSELGEEAARRHRLDVGGGMRRRKATKDRASYWARAAVWVGYRMIALGCRLARPEVLAAARARL
jgi:hypothetical protein